MEDFPGSLPEAKPNDNQEKKKKRRDKGTSLRIPKLVTLDNQEKAQPSELDKALENLAEKRKEKAKKTEKLEEKGEIAIAVPDTTAGTAETSEEHDAGTVEEDETDEDDETYVPLQTRELGAEEFSGGEVILHFRNDAAPVQEVVSPSAEPEQLDETAIDMPVFSRQLEQQHQASEQQDPVEPPEPLAADDVETSPVVPDIPFASFEQSPEPIQPLPETVWPRPEDIYSQPSTSAPNFAPTAIPNEEMVTKKQAEEAAYYAARAGQNRGLVTGLLVGGAYEHFKHKRREKRQAKRFQQQGKQLEQTRTAQHFFLNEQTRRQADNERRLTATEKRFDNVPKTEKLTPNTVPIETTEQLIIPPEHRLETSAWHTIEVDSKTGRPVENPSFQYGHEYYREHAQEHTPAAQRNAAAGEVALVAAAAAGSRTTPTADNGVMQQPIPDATSQGPPPNTSAAKTDSTSKPGPKSPASTGPLWPWLVALAVIICLIVLIR